MSLGCYPLSSRASLRLEAQPVSMDVAYDDDLFLCVVDQGKGVAIFNLSSNIDNQLIKENDSDNDEDNHHSSQKRLIKKVSFGDSVTVDQIVYCKKADYIACIGNCDGVGSVYVMFNWRDKCVAREPQITELNLRESLMISSLPLEAADKLTSIDCCQMTGNLAVACGDVILIYHYTMISLSISMGDPIAKGSTPGVGQGSIIEEDSDTPRLRNHDHKHHYPFKHIISLKLSLWASSLRLIENYLSITSLDHVQVLKLELLRSNFIQVHSDDDCITWNLNTKKLIKLPSLMHNSSSNLSSYHICHPSELLGPASETIACRVSASIYSPKLSQNQLEVVVLLCKQLDNNTSNGSYDDNERPLSSQRQFPPLSQSDRMLAAQLEPIYLDTTRREERAPRAQTPRSSHSASSKLAPSAPDQQTNSDYPPQSSDSDNDEHGDSCSVGSTGISDDQQASSGSTSSSLSLSGDDDDDDEQHESEQHACKFMLKSASYRSLKSVCCFVNTPNYCHVYQLHGKKVTRLHTILHPDLCLDLRPDLLNLLSLNPLGLQICSLGSCDANFHYDWSSSGDLNLSFIGTDRSRVLVSKNYIILVSCSHQHKGCLVEFMSKPNLANLYTCILHTVHRCHSNSIRTNLLTYLHAMCHLSLAASGDDGDNGAVMTTPDSHQLMGDQQRQFQLDLLKKVTIELCKQLLQKKQTNVITNNRIDKTIKHLLQFSHCHLPELTRRTLENRYHSQLEDHQPPAGNEHLSISMEQANGADDNDDSLEQSMNLDHELIKIYLKHAKYSTSFMDYLIEQEARDQEEWSRLVKLLFDHNPRLLIECAQRFPLRTTQANFKSMRLLCEMLNGLLEFNSTGINRATVLFTLAIIYESMGDRERCLVSLDQIKPLNHLAITMNSIVESKHHPIGKVVRERYPELFAANASLGSSAHEQADRQDAWSAGRFARDQRRAFSHSSDEEADDDGDASGECYERKLKLVANLPSLELLELLVARPGAREPAAPATQSEADSAAGVQISERQLLEASINLLESEFILARLREHSH